MATRLTHRITYQAELAAVDEMLSTAAFREAVCERQRVVRHDVTIDDRDGDFVVRVAQVQSTAQLPSFARKLVGSEIEIVQEERWTAVEHADLTVTIPGQPGDISGSIELAELDGTTTETVDLSIRVGIPLVGGKLESLLADLMRAALETEQRVGRDWLTDH